ncbi:dienelactone hydrolase family protein [Paenibacillus sp. An7]|uniref:dienelactone hydrolase family protein n=1 Tax=Paenibacillus sp. An7 TaxID=2689577 RepID=UPI001359DCBA|nr:dienelactone hydrolase family protein [Paenibacillus sp. An7]
MSKETSSSRALVIVLHEIYGVNDHIHFFSEILINEGFDVLVPNLIHRDSFSYDHEDIAYQYFVNEIGFKKSVREVEGIIKVKKAEYDQVFIIGFSIGATIAWMCSEYDINGVIGYYGSRIRDYKEIEPSCPALLFFPTKEKSFNVTDLEMDLKEKKYTLIKIIEAEHGFMNPFYRTYDSKESNNCIEISLEFLKTNAIKYM